MSARAYVLSLLSVYLLSATPATATGTTSLVRSYEGSTFFDRWTYYGNYDNTTEGDAEYVNRTVAVGSPELTYINSAGNAIIKVDNTSTVAYNDKRNTVKILSTDTYDVGSVWVLDAVHLPYGCSVWPSFWSENVAETWPEGGEIDTFEGVNNQVSNQMALHTESGCSLTASSSAYTGIVNATDCDYSANDNSGCGVTVDNSASYGAAFASAGGGAFITELSETGISIWFFSRTDIPSAVTNANASIDTRELGTPSAFWSNTGCNIQNYFKAQSLILDITLCGSWAGQSAILASTGCSALTGTETCYETYVLDGANYADAYFEIKSIKVYSNGTASTNATTSTSKSGAMAAVDTRGMWWGGLLGLMGVVASFVL
ncbi:hypothetical protein P7C73_g3342, partial [Tremellales sp. Uapishka_1]